MTAVPAPGFANPTQDAQRIFRRLLDAMSRPGTHHTVHGPAEAPEALGPALAGVLLTLLDEQTSVHLRGDLADAAALDYLAFHTGAPQAPLSEAAFVLTRPGDLPALDELSQGTDESPQLSATLVVDARSRFADGTPQRWTGDGPGVKDTVAIEATWAPADFLDQWRAVGERFPRGIDVMVVGDEDVLALPRTCHLTPQEA